ncbi:CT20-domain-containing protein [Aspergillus ellipticus CBS 707.79]|uniref:CT20-domain-containing protein n=1 Tax=Aspergillus ellipticus CBS 707.79 TaxID=1448320 RepID=A0A319DMD3_9EURO|nr:CT20-domain-containing protein [Aspergillus ellipticus CBS 707.79]
MPPRKKAKLTPQTENAGPSASTAGQPTTDYDPVTDPWTDEQETALLKGIIKWKPVGMHKHFRMIAISEFMKSQGYAPANAEHTRIPGIWKKLGTLYNLPALDEREDSLITENPDDIDGLKELYCPFELPEDEYGDLMFERRLAMEGSASPDPSTHAESRRGSTVADTDEPRSSPAPSRGRKPGRGGRQSGRGTRSSRLHVEVEAPTKGSGAGEEEADSGEETGPNEEGDEEGSDGAKDDSDVDEEAEGDTGGSPTTRSTRAQTSRTKQKERKSTGTGTRRGRRRQP